MKSLFKGFYKISGDKFVNLWQEATFVFDTNVLLNLYRYKGDTRKQLLEVLEKLSDRIWIPYHVGLEFHNKRLGVIAEQISMFSEVEDTVLKNQNQFISSIDKFKLKKEHSLINPDKLIDGFKELVNTFLKELDSLKGTQADINDNDDLIEKINLLFTDKIGQPPENQEQIDEIVKDGEWRYKHGIPPGFEDEDKDKHIYYGGILYEKKYGDLIIWKQIIEFAKTNNIKHLIFVTDDNKKDWWHKIKSEGEKTVGPRTELIDEICRESDVKVFHIYKPGQFLEYSKTYLDTDISDDAIEEVKSISSKDGILNLNLSYAEIAVTSAIYEWLFDKFAVINTEQSKPDFVAIDELNNKVGFDVKIIRDPIEILKSFDSIVHNAFTELTHEKYSDYFIVFCALDPKTVSQITSYVDKKKNYAPNNVNFIVGYCNALDHEADNLIFIHHNTIINDSLSRRKSPLRLF